VGAKSGQKKGGAKRSVSRNRVALIGFGALFVVLFVGFAVGQGLGSPSVPSGDVAVVKGVPDGNVTEADFKHGYEQQLGQSSVKKPPKPGSKKAEELNEAALGEILDAIWIKGEAEELNISVTEKQIETELAQIKKSSFPTEKSFQEFLKTSHFTAQDVNDRVELQLLSTKIQEEIKKQTAPPTSSEISDFYDANKASKYTKPASRDIRVVISKDKAEVEKALAALEKDNSPKSWKAVAGKYSEDETTKSAGGLQKGVTEELLPPNLQDAVFKGATGEVQGPLSFRGQFLVLEVVNINAEKVQTLEEVKSEISTELAQKSQEEFFTEFVSSYQTKWQARTTCASGHVIERCGNFKSPGHPSTAPAACYEANPKIPAQECPAPVEQTKPALPGTTTPENRQGERLVQRPRPEAAKGTAGEKGAPPTEGAAPSEGAPEGSGTKKAGE
jgi:parvulin-like peptidyl-prolyl isomerase